MRGMSVLRICTQIGHIMAHLMKGSVVGTVTLCLAATFGVAGVSEAQATTTAVASVATVRASSKPTFKQSSARYGAKSKSVRNLQTLLIRKGYATSALASSGATGAYYKATRASVKKLQRKLGYSKRAANGIIERRSAQRLGLTWVADTTSTTLSTAASLPQGTNGSALSPTQLKSVLLTAGFREPVIRTAYGIAMRESRGYPRVVSPLNSNNTRDHGLFQINDIHRSTTDFTNIYDPVYNAQVAYRLSNGGKDFTPWGIGTSGWAGTLKKDNPKYWQMLQDEMVRFRNQYPG